MAAELGEEREYDDKGVIGMQSDRRVILINLQTLLVLFTIYMCQCFG